jgi:hypothetical protein
MYRLAEKRRLPPINAKAKTLAAPTVATDH